MMEIRLPIGTLARLWRSNTRWHRLRPPNQNKNDAWAPETKPNRWDFMRRLSKYVCFSSIVHFHWESEVGHIFILSFKLLEIFDLVGSWKKSHSQLRIMKIFMSEANVYRILKIKWQKMAPPYSVYEIRFIIYMKAISYSRCISIQACLFL